MHNQQSEIDQQLVDNFRAELADELEQLLNWWKKYAQDHGQGGFFGKIDRYNKVDVTSPKGLVLNARILYTFSTAYLHDKSLENLVMAERAYAYLTAYFLDGTSGGFYWAVDFNGRPLDTKKQIYGQAFAVYGLATYYKATGDGQALELAKETFRLIEAHSFDRENSGYIEALAQDWQPMADLRLSEKDLNEKKSMNTHLHVVEAYTALFNVWEDGQLKKSIEQLLENFRRHIIDPKTYHLNLFFTETWEIRSTAISFGHDIEAAWLLQEAAEIIGHQPEAFEQIAIHMAEAAVSGLAPNGGLCHEFDPTSNQLTKEFHWWPQAEAMVGFVNAFRLSGREEFFRYALNCWTFIKNFIRDEQNGEWFWGVQGDSLAIMPDEDKAGFWKCPYHNIRALLELVKRL